MKVVTVRSLEETGLTYWVGDVIPGSHPSLGDIPTS